jgi:hypothetical protein
MTKKPTSWHWSGDGGPFNTRCGLWTPKRATTDKSLVGCTRCLRAIRKEEELAVLQEAISKLLKDHPLHTPQEIIEFIKWLT